MSLNRSILQGNLCKDVELLQTNNGGTYLRNTIASQRNYSKEGQEKQSDFISILAYGKTAEFIQNYFKKGDQILVEGRIQTGNYDKQDGTKVYTTDLVVEHVYFCGNKKIESNTSAEIPSQFTQTTVANDFSVTGDDLPF